MTEGSSPTVRGKLGTNMHVLTDKKGIPLSAVMSSASVHDVKLATDVVDDAVAKRRIPHAQTKTGRKRKLQHLCLDKSYNSSPKSKQSQNEDMCHIYRAREKEARSRREKKKPQIAKNILQEDGLWKEPTHGTTGLDSYSHDMKRRWKTILG